MSRRGHSLYTAHHVHGNPLNIHEIVEFTNDTTSEFSHTNNVSYKIKLIILDTVLACDLISDILIHFVDLKFDT